MSITRHTVGPRMSQAVVHNGTVYLAGQVAADESTVKGQTQAILKKIDGLLAAAGSSKSKLLWAQVWLADIREKEQMDAAWKAWVDPNNKPVRACVEARLGTPETRVEIMVTAAKG